MRSAKWFGILAVLILFTATTASADAVDPQIIVRGGVASTIYLTGATVFLNFAGTPGCTSGVQSGTGYPTLVCAFQNVTGSSLFQVDFFISPALQLPLTLTCSLCSAPPIGSANGALATFFLTPGLIGNKDDFVIEFINFSQNTTIGVATVPEPATLGLFLTGVGALVTRRRLRKGKPTVV